MKTKCCLAVSALAFCGVAFFQLIYLRQLLVTIDYKQASQLNIRLDSGQHYISTALKEAITSYLPPLDPPHTSHTVAFFPTCVADDTQLEQLLMSQRTHVKRLQFSCNGKDVITELIQKKASEAEPFAVQWTDPCLVNFSKHCHCHDNKKVPNLVHYVWFGQRNVTPECMVSVLSAVRFQRPCAVLFHSDVTPSGLYWRLLMQLVPELVLVHNPGKERVFGRKFGYVQHKADIARIEILQKLGGIYLDTDQLLLRSLNGFREDAMVMSMEGPKNLANSLMLTSPGAAFLDLWYRRYRFYKPKKWGYDSTFVPFELAQKHPGLIRVANHSFVYPDIPAIRLVFQVRYNLSNNFGLHLYTRFVNVPLDLSKVSRWNNSLGDVWRLVLYGQPHAGLFSCLDCNVPMALR